MEYPGTHFTRPWRLAFLIFFIIAFLIISPLLILYTSGYSYDFKNGIIQETGAISIDILPKNATAYLNGAKLKAKIPIRLKNLAQGKYYITLSADGFYDWQKEISVENKQTTYIKEIKLIKKSQPVKLTDKKIESLFLSKNNGSIIYQTQDNPPVFGIYDLEKNTETEVFVGKKDKNYHVVMPEAKNNFATIANDDLSEIYIIDKNNPKNIWNLASEEKNKITKFQWTNNSQPELFYSTKNQLIAINVTTKQRSIIGKNNFIDWKAYNNQILVLQTSSTSEQIYVIKDVFGFSKNLATLNNFQNTENKKTDWQIMDINNERVLLKKNNSSEMLLIDQEKQFTLMGDKNLTSDFNNWLVVWTPWEITTYSHGEDPFLLNRSGEQLKKIIVLDEYNTLGLVWADKMTALFPYYFVSHNLINTKISDAVANNQKRELYFSANIDNQDGLWKIEY